MNQLSEPPKWTTQMNPPSEPSDDVPFDSFSPLLKDKLETLQQISVTNKTSDSFKKSAETLFELWHFTYLVNLTSTIIRQVNQPNQPSQPSKAAKWT